ncbi:MAG: hypothetical protein R3B06_00310 [Kofleriaceae bacterium]
MMDLSGYLPDPATLDALLSSAGVRRAPAELATALGADVGRTGDAPRPAAAAVELIRFPSGTRAPAAPADDDTIAWDPAELDEEPSGGRSRERITLPPIEHAGGERPRIFDGLDSIEAKLAVLVDWIMGTMASYSAFIADGDGLALANRNAPDNYVAATALIGRAQRMIDTYVPAPVDGATSMELDDGNTLQIVWVTTDAGWLAAGIVLTEPLPRPICVTVRDMVRAAVANEEAR